MDTEVKIALAICESINTPRSLSVAILLSVASRREKLTFSHKGGSKADVEMAWVEYLKLQFDPYALPSIRLPVRWDRSLITAMTHGHHRLSRKARRSVLEQFDLYHGNIDVIKNDYQATVFLQKWKGLKLDAVDPEAAARRSFFQSERECYETNQRFREVMSQIGEDRRTSVPQTLPPALIKKLLDVRKIFRNILGGIPPKVDLRFGPGAVYEKRESYLVDTLTAIDKLDAPPCLTPAAVDLFYHAWRTTKWFETWKQRAVRFDLPLHTTSLCERYFTVHKKATMARGCGLGPGGNVAYQLGIAQPMRFKLQKQGLLLTPEEVVERHWQSLTQSGPQLPRVAGSEGIHHMLARMGSLDDSYATVDFSRASDTVAREPVRFLASEEWFFLLDAVRTKYVEIDFSTNELSNDLLNKGVEKSARVVLEKFSSMGNGYTFELETLIFYSIARAVCDEHEIISVYGDDVILPGHRAADFISVARFFGFTPNVEKTYVSGPFRESCGGDFLHGQNIRPFFLKENLNEVRHYVSAANGLYRSSHRAASGNHVLSRAWRRCVELIPLAYRLRGPEILGDAVLHCHDYEKHAYQPKRWKPKRKHRVRARPGTRVQPYTQLIELEPESYEPWTPLASNRYFKGLKFTPLKRPQRYHEEVILLSMLYGIPSDGVAPRGAELSMTVEWFEVG